MRTVISITHVKGPRTETENNAQFIKFLGYTEIGHSEVSANTSR